MRRPQADTLRTAPRKVADPYEIATSLIMHVAILLLGLDVSVGFGATAALVLAAVTSPLWLMSLRAYPLARAIVFLSGLAVVWGFILSRLAAVDHEVSRTVQVQMIGLLLSGVAGFVLLLWVRPVIPLSRIIGLYGAGALAGALVQGEHSWKYNLAVPTTYLVLGIAQRARRNLVPVAAIVGLGVLGLLDEGRSFFGLCLLAATLTIWQRRPHPGEGAPKNRWLPVGIVAGLAVAGYMLATALLSGGYLGSEAQERSTKQIEASGSLIAGGRPEWAATRELVELRPEGYGLGVVPNYEDVMAGKKGLSELNVDLEENRRQYMFGGQFRLHSVGADLWVSFGLVGVALAALIFFALVRSLSFLLAGGRATTAVVFATLLATWHLLFGPIYSNWDDVCFGLGLVLVVRSNKGSARDGDS